HPQHSNTNKLCVKRRYASKFHESTSLLGGSTVHRFVASVNGTKCRSTRDLGVSVHPTAASTSFHEVPSSMRSACAQEIAWCCFFVSNFESGSVPSFLTHKRQNGQVWSMYLEGSAAKEVWMNPRSVLRRYLTRCGMEITVLAESMHLRHIVAFRRNRVSFLEKNG